MITPLLTLAILNICGLSSASPAYNSLMNNNVVVQINSTAGPITKLFTLRTIETHIEKRFSAEARDDGEEGKEPSLVNPFAYINDDELDKGLKFGRALGLGMGLNQVYYDYKPFFQLRELYDAEIIYAGPSDVLCVLLCYNNAEKTTKMRMHRCYLTTRYSLNVGSEPLYFIEGIVCVAPNNSRDHQKK